MKEREKMAEFQLHSNCLCSNTIIPNRFIDEYMTAANGEFVKVYLYLLRALSSNTMQCSISAIADHFDHTEADVIRALKYWDKMQLISLEYDKNNNICGLHFIDLNQTSGDNSRQIAASIIPDTSSIPITQATTKKKATKRNPQPSKKSYTLNEVKGFRSNPDISELFFIIESYLKHPLSESDINIVLYWYDQLSFGSDLIIYLTEYCISEGHSSLRYMDKVAQNWHENQITTIDAAKNASMLHNQSTYTVMKAMGITGRNLVDRELTYIKRWTSKYCFGLDIIKEACDRTIAATQKPNFEYAERILSNWYSKQVHTMDDIAAIDQEYTRTKTTSGGSRNHSSSTRKSNSFNNFNQRDYDYEQLEKVLLTTSVE